LDIVSDAEKVFTKKFEESQNDTSMF